MTTGLIQNAALHFRSYLYTVMPLYESLIEEMCAQPEPPLELATTLEDIGQHYMGLADRLNQALIEKGRLAAEPDADDSTEALVDAFVLRLIAKAGVVKLRDGSRVQGSEALSASPFVADALRAALLVAHSAGGSSR